MRSVEWSDGDIVIIDQTRLPERVEYLRLINTDQIAEAIRAMRVRGAPVLGIVGAMGVAQAALRTRSASARAVFAAAVDAGSALRATRPTAVNLGWAIDRVLDKGRRLVATAGATRLAQMLADEALAIQVEDDEACTAMAKHAQGFFRHRGVVMTHCNTGFLCTGGSGTALGAIRLAYETGLEPAVIATETRPLLQGARLTAWELGRLGIPHAIVVDGAAPGLIARDDVSLVIVGADRVAANGDVANKVGTYPLALAAREANVPFVVVAPRSSIDLSTPEGSAIEVEERAPEEVTSILGGLQLAPPGTTALNPAFDITPAELVTAIVTELGVSRPPFERSLRALARGARAAAPVKEKPATKTAKKQAAPKPKLAKKPAAKRQPAVKKAATKKPALTKAKKKQAAKKKPASRRANKRR